MKILTESNYGVVIEINRNEYFEIAKLIDAVEGKTFDESYQFEFRPDRVVEQVSYDLSTTFGAIRAFYQSKFRVNEIQRGLDILKNSLKDADA